MNKSETQMLVDAVNARYTDPERNIKINEVPGQKPFLELYHFALSVCSAKVRTVLNEKQATYMSHDINILPPGMQNYFPEYVRLRMSGAKNLLDNMVSGYTGRSATETEGFDPCVVPTLVDHEAGKILINSKQICLHINSVINTGTNLIPEDIADAVMHQVDIVDQTPHPAVLYGANPDGDGRADFVQEGMNGIHDKKISEIRENMAQAGDDPLLISAYEHKILKETAARQHVSSEEKMRASIEEFKKLLSQLEKDLNKTGGEWLLGDRFTLADVFWAVSLFRMQWLGMSYLWEADEGVILPKVLEYSQRLFKRPSFASGVIHWPGTPPSPHVMEYYQ